MLPIGKKDKGTALQVIYTVWLILFHFATVLGYTGKLFCRSALRILLGLWMLFYAVKLYKLRTTKAARTLMLVMFYIPVTISLYNR
jgi:protoheme IX farnesyltransferase